MAKITVNETGSQPLILLSTDIANGNVQTGNIVGANVLSVGCLQDVTITSSTGVFSWTDFCSVDTNKLPTPADNEIATNVVIDDIKWFGNANAASGSAAFAGMASLSQNKVEVQFLVVWNNNDVGNVTGGNIANGTYWSSGVGYITNLAPTVSPDAPVWVSPMSLAVNGTMYSGNG
jgi:hypothetical protein